MDVVLKIGFTSADSERLPTTDALCAVLEVALPGIYP
jgi:hypothetical protein